MSNSRFDLDLASLDKLWELPPSRNSGNPDFAAIFAERRASMESVARQAGFNDHVKQLMY